MIAKTSSGFFAAEKEAFTQMLYADAVRGKDATGIFGVNREGNVEWMKQAAPAGWFVTTQKYNEFAPKIVQEMHMVIGHNRKATHGDKKDADAHPFIKDNITLVHNGMIRNHKELCKESTVDSNAIANALAESDDIEKTLRKAEGAFAFIWYDGKTKNLHFIRNKERPLAIVETDKAWFLASEAMLAGWCLSRNSLKYTDSINCEEDTLYTINLTEKKLESRKLDLKKHYLPQQYNYPKSNDGVWQGWDNSTEDDYTLFLDETTVGGNTVMWAERGQQVMMEVTEYSDYTKPGYLSPNVQLTGRILNCALRGPKVKATVPVTDMPEILQSCVVNGMISNIVYGKETTIYLNLVTPAIIEETKNGLFISEEMFNSPDFPSKCTKCHNTPIAWKALPETEVDFRYRWRLSPDVNCVCPSCQEKEKNVQPH